MMFKILIIILVTLIVAFGALAVSKYIPKTFLANSTKQNSEEENSVTDTIESFIAPEATPLALSSKSAVTANKYADGNLPLGDDKYVTDKAKKGYIYLCRARSDEGIGGAQAAGPWINTTAKTWNLKQKIAVGGRKTWSNAAFTNSVSGSSRNLIGNDLPINHPTGTFPVAQSDKAYQYDRNPNSISAQTLSISLPTNPTYSSTPYCMGGEVGVMLTGVELFNGFDATLKDAAAWEVQDDCEGHPQVSGTYHYHSLSSCINDVSTATVIGYALDGYPITGPLVEKDKYLTTDDLDECHGISSEIVVDGQKKSTYHYVMTQDFPYSVSCFRAKPVSLQITKQTTSTGGSNIQPPLTNSNMSPSQTASQQIPSQQNNGNNRQPPQEAITVCASASQGATCQFNAPDNRTISGTCRIPPGQTSLICVPNQMQH